MTLNVTYMQLNINQRFLINTKTILVMKKETCIEFHSNYIYCRIALRVEKMLFSTPLGHFFGLFCLFSFVCLFGLICLFVGIASSSSSSSSIGLDHHRVVHDRITNYFNIEIIIFQRFLRCSRVSF